MFKKIIVFLMFFQLVNVVFADADTFSISVENRFTVFDQAMKTGFESFEATIRGKFSSWEYSFDSGLNNFENSVASKFAVFDNTVTNGLNQFENNVNNRFSAFDGNLAGGFSSFENIVNGQFSEFDSGFVSSWQGLKENLQVTLGDEFANQNVQSDLDQLKDDYLSSKSDLETEIDQDISDREGEVSDELDTDGNGVVDDVVSSIGSITVKFYDSDNSHTKGALAFTYVLALGESCSIPDYNHGYYTTVSNTPVQLSGDYEQIGHGYISNPCNYSVFNMWNAGSSVTNISSNLPTLDSDGDGVSDAQEAIDGTDPNDPNDFLDSDGDGIPDSVENSNGTDPNDPNSGSGDDPQDIPDVLEWDTGFSSLDKILEKLYPDFQKYGTQSKDDWTWEHQVDLPMIGQSFTFSFAGFDTFPWFKTLKNIIRSISIIAASVVLYFAIIKSLRQW